MTAATIADIILIIMLSSIPAAFNYFADYCLGHPMDDKPNIKEIFSGYSLYLAKRRLRSIKNDIQTNYSLLDAIEQTFYSRLSSDNPHIRLDASDQLKKTILLEAQKYYYFEKAIGMCPYCTNFWISLISAVIFFFTVTLTVIHPLFFFILIPIFSHAILRKL